MKILVTGTSKGLGFAIAERLAKRYSVIGCARSPLKIPSNSFTHIAGVDFREPGTFDKLPLEEFDALVNNAGMAVEGLLATQPDEALSEVIDVNLKGTLLLTKKYVRARLADRKSGNIVNISSIIGIRGYAGLAAYAATKAGLDGATRALARELGPKGFRVNSVLPGYMKTDMVTTLDEQQLAQITRRTPLGRLATVEDVAAAVEFLLAGDCLSLTGQSIVVDGGLST
jgi:3-oxoacyl-[acyl-carrier protein] reductase